MKSRKYCDLEIFGKDPGLSVDKIVVFDFADIHVIQIQIYPGNSIQI